jgi:cysteinyl-tRNA synthetase
MSTLIVYNSLTKKKEVFQTITPGHVKMYCCGPTVYDLLHVGNFRGAIFYNFVRNWLEHLGYKVTFVYNYTDVDDKIIRRSIDEKTSSDVVAEKYIQEFEKDFSTLGLRKHDFNPRVTTHMNEIISIIQVLIEKKKAYVVDGEVLYSISSFKEYGKLSGRNPDELIAGARVEVDQRKQNPLDFALWKPSKPGEPSWPSPWGPGRPGWHIECSAMVYKILGEEIDIHGGGSDLIFPHHENEIAQSEGCTGHTLARYWIHNNMFTFSGQKMSKSLGNVWKAREFLEEYNAEIYKYMVLSVHYRSLSEFSEMTADLAIKALARVYSSLALAENLIKESGEEEQPNPEWDLKINNHWENIAKSFNDDFGTPEAFAEVFELIREFNQQFRRGMKLSPKLKRTVKSYLNFMQRFGNLLSLFQQDPQKFLMELDDRLLLKKNLKREDIDQLVLERQKVREAKDYKRADELRTELSSMGIQVADTPQGSFWEVQK